MWPDKVSISTLTSRGDLVFFAINAASVGWSTGWCIVGVLMKWVKAVIKVQRRSDNGNCCLSPSSKRQCSLAYFVYLKAHLLWWSTSVAGYSVCVDLNDKPGRPTCRANGQTVQLLIREHKTFAVIKRIKRLALLLFALCVVKLYFIINEEAV